jgi:ABC-type Fe3+ transport system permease subunit
MQKVETKTLVLLLCAVAVALAYTTMGIRMFILTWGEGDLDVRESNRLRLEARWSSMAILCTAAVLTIVICNEARSLITTHSEHYDDY